MSRYVLMLPFLLASTFSLHATALDKFPSVVTCINNLGSYTVSLSFEQPLDASQFLAVPKNYDQGTTILNECPVAMRSKTNQKLKLSTGGQFISSTDGLVVVNNSNCFDLSMKNILSVHLTYSHQDVSQYKMHLIISDGFVRIQTSLNEKYICKVNQ